MLQYELLKIVLKIMDEFKEKIGLIVDFWTNDIILITKVKIEMWIQKFIILRSMFFEKNRTTSNEVSKSLMHWNFPYIYSQFNIALSSFINPFLVQDFIFLHGCFYQIYVEEVN
jgi:hypothetical protein